MVSSRNLARNGDRDLEMTDFHPRRSFVSPPRRSAKGAGTGHLVRLTADLGRFAMHPLGQSLPLISTSPSSVNWRRRSFRSAMLSNRVRWR
jgi:hypothetical protein